MYVHIKIGIYQTLDVTLKYNKILFTDQNRRFKKRYKIELCCFTLFLQNEVSNSNIKQTNEKNAFQIQSENFVLRKFLFTLVNFNYFIAKQYSDC